MDSTFDYTPLVPVTQGSGIPAKLVVSGASLAPSESCTFSLVLDVAVGAAGGTYPNTTSEVTATVEGKTVTGKPASDGLAVVAAPTLKKEFTDDPVAPGGTATLEFILAHDENAPGDATDIAFTDDLTAVLPGLTATGLPANDVCGAGSQIDGTTNLTFTGGSLAPGETCTFSVTLDVPATAPAGPHTNTTSSVVATVLGLTATENAASDDLDIAGLVLTKEFTDDPALPGDTVNLRFTIENTSPASDATGISFQDDLDEALDNLAATASSVPQNDICGAGSSLTGSAGNRVLTFQDGSLLAGESCTFDVELQVPSGAQADTYVNRTSGFRGTIDGSLVAFDDASDELIIDSDLLLLAKEFIDDPVVPGGTANLEFTLTNLSSTFAFTNVAFSDDLDAALPGLVATGLPQAACGGTVAGTSVISFTGGSLAAGETCSFTVSLSVPSDALLGTVAVNTTSPVTGQFGLLLVTGDPATDELRIESLDFGKSFDGPVFPGGTSVLTFSIRNTSPTETVTDLSFSDKLDAVITGLVTSTSLPVSDVCGAGSELGGTPGFLILTGGSLLPSGSCTFSVDLEVPGTAAPGSYLNVTSQLRRSGGAVAAAPATATLIVEPVIDADGDGVPDDIDVCLGTVIPEDVPTQRLGRNRYALVDGDTVFDTNPPNGIGPSEVFTTDDTAGCSCRQIIEAQGLGAGHEKFGCSLGAMREWVELVNP